MESDKENKINKGGRPKGNKREFIIVIRVSKQEKEIILKNANKFYKKTSSYGRLLMVEGIKKFEFINISEQILKLRNELRKSGININQIAKKINSIENNNWLTSKDKNNLKEINNKYEDVFKLLNELLIKL